jgi:hypothetical protein
VGKPESVFYFTAGLSIPLSSQPNNPYCFMKKIILIASFLITSLSISAQTDQGTLFVGGGLNFGSAKSKTKTTTSTTSTTQDGFTTTSFGISPGIGYFVSDKLAIGLDISYQGSTDKAPAPSDVKFRNTAFGFTPYLRYYLMLEDNFGFTGSFGVSVSSITSKSTSGSTTVDGPKGSNLAVGITPGIVYFPTTRIGLEANFGFLGFTSSKQEEINGSNNKVETTNTEFGLKANSLQPTTIQTIPFGLQFAFRYYFAK